MPSSGLWGQFLCLYIPTNRHSIKKKKVKLKTKIFKFYNKNVSYIPSICIFLYLDSYNMLYLVSFFSFIFFIIFSLGMCGYRGPWTCSVALVSHSGQAFHICCQYTWLNIEIFKLIDVPKDIMHTQWNVTYCRRNSTTFKVGKMVQCTIINQKHSLNNLLLMASLLFFKTPRTHFILFWRNDSMAFLPKIV